MRDLNCDLDVCKLEPPKSLTGKGTSENSEVVPYVTLESFKGQIKKRRAKPLKGSGKKRTTRSRKSAVKRKATRKTKVPTKSKSKPSKNITSKQLQLLRNLLSRNKKQRT